MDLKRQRLSHINSIYKQIVNELMTHGNQIDNTIELTNYSFILTNPRNNIATIRDISLKYLCGEFIWYFSGRQDTDFISQYAPFWKTITDNGRTSNSAYGHILQYRHGFNQIDKIIELLNRYPTTRRAVLNFNVPNENVIETKDEICTISMIFLKRENKLHAYVTMRSNDIYHGLPYDVAFFTTLQHYVAMRINCELGEYYHHAISIHLYLRDKDKLLEAMSSFDNKNYGIDTSKLLLQLSDINTDPDVIVTDFINRGILYEN